MTRHIPKILAIALALGLSATAAACGTDSGGTKSAGATGCEAYKTYGDLSGKKVSLYATFVDTEGASYEASFKKFTECTGAQIAYEGSKDFTVDLPKRVEAGAVPDLAVFPQPGLLADTAKSGTLKAAPEAVGKNVDTYWTESWRGYGTVDSTLYAAPLGASMKSLVWYSPSMFDEAGYTVPTTWDELSKLTAKIAADGDVKPWCAGIEDGQATGWVATDWVEDMVLRFGGGEAYDKWVSHEIPFNDPSIVKSLDELSTILRNDQYVNGGIDGVQSIAATAWTDAGTPILDGQCYMHRQASFYGQNFADDGAEVGESGDVWAFYLPSEDGKSKPIVGGGDFVAAFSDSPEVVAFQTYLSSPEWANEKAKVTEAGWTTANNGLDPANLKSPVDKLAFTLLSDPTSEFRLDGSDLMPSEVGSGAFWKEMTAFFAENKPVKDVADAIESGWPK